MVSLIKYLVRQIISYTFYIFGGLYWLKRLLRRKPVLLILNYHNFSRYNNYKVKRGNILTTGYIVNFEKQVHFLKKHFSFIYPNDFFTGRSKANINILLTFDDGYKDNYDLAMPILKKHNAKAIFFIATRAVEKNELLFHDKIRYLIQINAIPEAYNEKPTKMYRGEYNYSNKEIKYVEKKYEKFRPKKRLMMNALEVKKLSQENFLIGNHTNQHIALPFYNREDQQKDIQRADNYIKNIIGRKTMHFAYPNGLFNEDTIELLQQNHYSFAYTINGGANTLQTNKYKLRRIGMNVSDNLSTMVFKLFIYNTIKKGKIK